VQKKAIVQHLYLGKNPPIITMVRALEDCVDGDHLVDFFIFFEKLHSSLMESTMQLALVSLCNFWMRMP
jgi:hypothetical protein